MLVTTLKASDDVPIIELVTEGLLHEERKLKERTYVSESLEKSMNLHQHPRRKALQCYDCGKLRHISETAESSVGRS